MNENPIFCEVRRYHEGMVIHDKTFIEFFLVDR